MKMNHDIERQIRQLENMKLTFPIEPDEHGYIDKECPSEKCMFKFKVLEQDWETLSPDGKLFCPLCGKSAPADSFYTTEQTEEAERQAVEQVECLFNQNLKTMADDFNRKQPRNAWIRITMNVKGSTAPKSIMPLKALEELQLKIECEKCGVHFAVLGGGFFCPRCGYSSAIRVFEDAMKKIRAKISNLDSIRKVVSEISKDDAELTCRSLVESCLSDGVVAFQRACEQLYSQHPSAKLKLKANVFQRLDEGSELWKELAGKTYVDLVGDEELNRLNLYFQRRHLLLHKEGIVDDKYIKKSGDVSYQVGQRIVVKENDILDMVQILIKMINRLREAVQA